MRRFYSILIALCIALSVSATDRALLIGIGQYETDKTGWSRIHGDVDVDMVSNALLNQGFDKSNILILKNQAATKAGIIAEFRRLTAMCRPGDRVFILFSCHGQRVKDFNHDEADGLDETIVTYDAYKTARYKHNGKNYRGENHLIDDELSRLLDDVKAKIARKGLMFVAFDACYSEGLEMNDSESFPPEDLEIMGKPRGTSDVLIVDDSYLKRIAGPKQFTKGAKMIIVSACRADERNFEYIIPGSNKAVGSLSHCITRLLRKDADFDRWQKYFENKEYKGKKMFVSFQHPTLTVYP